MIQATKQNEQIQGERYWAQRKDMSRMKRYKERYWAERTDTRRESSKIVFVNLCSTVSGESHLGPASDKDRSWQTSTF